MKIFMTSDWHIGHKFHGTDRLPEHEHFFNWLLAQLEAHRPDALLVAGDVFDNSNPSAEAQKTYYNFLGDVTQKFPDLRIIITAGNHDSASRLEAPRTLLSRHNVEVRGNVHREWAQTEDGGNWVINYDDLMIPITGQDGTKAVVLAVPYLRIDVLQNADYNQGANELLSTLTAKAREKYPNARLVMMAHMYVKGADIAKKDASERIVIGGQEEVNLEGWNDFPDYMTCGHIHKRQHIWNTNWARYTGSVLPMSFAEVDYKHGIDLLTLNADSRPTVDFLEYAPQHKLCILPENDEELTFKKLSKLIDEKLENRKDGKLDDNSVYVAIKVKLEKVSNDEIKGLENLVGTKNAVLCGIHKIIPNLDLTTIADHQAIQSVDDILNRDPLDTLKESFLIMNNKEMNEHQEQMLRELLESITKENE